MWPCHFLIIFENFYPTISVYFVSIPCKNQNFEKMTFIANIQCFSDKEYETKYRITFNEYFQYF